MAAARAPTGIARKSAAVVPRFVTSRVLASNVSCAREVPAHPRIKMAQNIALTIREDCSAELDLYIIPDWPSAII
jgi:hypothetical protein